MHSDQLFFVYIIFSPSHHKFYKGVTNSLFHRLKQHNNRNSRFTKHFAPWTLVYAEAYSYKTDALKREKALKKYSHNQIQSLLNVDHPHKIDIDRFS